MARGGHKFHTSAVCAWCIVSEYAAKSVGTEKKRSSNSYRKAWSSFETPSSSSGDLTDSSGTLRRSVAMIVIGAVWPRENACVRVREGRLRTCHRDAVVNSIHSHSHFSFITKTPIGRGLGQSTKRGEWTSPQCANIQEESNGKRRATR